MKRDTVPAAASTWATVLARLGPAGHMV